MFDPTDRNFDIKCAEFTTLVRKAADWKHVYFGAAYATRIRQAVEDLEKAIKIAREHLEIE